MGAQVAAHLVAQGLDVALLDIVAAGTGDRSALAQEGARDLRKLKPRPLHLPEHAALHPRPATSRTTGRQLKDADWVFEAVVEDLEIKRQLFARVAAAVKKTAIVTTNTSGLGIGAMSVAPARRTSAGASSARTSSTRRAT